LIAGSEPLTVEESLRKASFYLKEAGIESPRDEAEFLLIFLLGWSRLKLFLQRTTTVESDLAAAFRAVVERRARGEPLAYITGEREFYGLDFEINREVLIPRPESELLIDPVLQWARLRKGWIRGVDLGCGSGNLAVTLAYHLPWAHFYAVDLSPGALKLARANARRHGVEGRIHFIQGDFLNAFTAMPEPPRFNLVISNPPYLRTAELEQLPPTIREYEPALALDGGPDGLEAYRRILTLLPRFLERPGLMALEIGSTQGGALLSLCREQTLFHRLVLHPDYQALPRILTALF
jgi:release factor glutamine methyltransferase